MNDIKVFSNEVFGNVRATLIEGKVWFVGKDIVEALDYKRTSYSDTIKRYCDEEDCIFLDSKTQPQNGVEFDYKELGQRGGYLINQYGVIDLVLQSQLPQAKQFKRWITHEVIPSILETGSYSVNRKPDSYMITDPVERAKRWIEETEEHQRQLAEKQAIINQQKPLVDYAEAMNNSTNEDMTIAQFARYTKLGKKELFKFFRDNKVLFYDNGVNVPYQKYIDKGYFKVITKVSQLPDGRYYNYEQTLITSKGRERVLNFYPQLKR